MKPRVLMCFGLGFLKITGWYGKGLGWIRNMGKWLYLQQVVKLGQLGSELLI